MYDLAIIGGGPAGVAAGVYASRKRLKTVFITKDFGGQSSVSEEIQNPNSSGQGHDPEHHMHPHHETLLKHGYEYSHSTPVSHPIDFSSEREKINHHTYKLKGHPDHNVSVHYSPKMAGNHKWEAGKSASNTSTTGRSTEALDKFLKGHVARAKRAAKK